MHLPEHFCSHRTAACQMLAWKHPEGGSSEPASTPQPPSLHVCRIDWERSSFTFSLFGFGRRNQADVQRCWLEENPWLGSDSSTDSQNPVEWQLLKGFFKLQPDWRVAVRMAADGIGREGGGVVRHVWGCRCAQAQTFQKAARWEWHEMISLIGVKL